MFGVLSKDGSATMIYDDLAKPYVEVIAEAPTGVAVSRASHVEPDPEKPFHWVIDFAPLAGPCYRSRPGDGYPLDTRTMALAVESEILKHRLLTGQWLAQQAEDN